MDVRMLADDGDLLRLDAVAGSMASDLLPDLRHFDELLGPGGYARQVALSLAQIALIDTLRMSWLLILHKRFCEAGGKLVVHSIRRWSFCAERTCTPAECWQPAPRAGASRGDPLLPS
jgi:hypothetical protein